MSSTTTAEKLKRPILRLNFGSEPTQRHPTRITIVVPVPAHTHNHKAAAALCAIVVEGVTYSLRAGFLAQCIVTEWQLSLEARTLGAYVACAAAPRLSDNFLKFKIGFGKFTPEYVPERLGFDVNAALKELIAARILKLEDNPFGGHSLRIRSGYIIRQLKIEHEWRVSKGRA